MFHDHLDSFHKPPLGVGLMQKPKDYDAPESPTISLLDFIMCENPAWIEIIEISLVEGPVT